MDFKLSQHAVDVTNARAIKVEWIDFVIQNPTLEVLKARDEVNFYAVISEKEDRCLKVVVNPITKVIITAYFDRNMRKRGCK